MENERLEKLGPAARILSAMTPYVDHAVHNRTGVVSADPGAAFGLKWHQARWYREAEAPPRVRKQFGAQWAADPLRQVVFLQSRDDRNKKAPTVHTPFGVLHADGKTVMSSAMGSVKVGEYRAPGFFTECVVWLYKQVASVWQVDHEFAARWASYAYTKDHEDMKVVLAAFMLMQTRFGKPITRDGVLAFYDEDFRDVGEAMLLISDDHFMNARLVDRVRQVLRMPEIAAVNHELGFRQSARRYGDGRWPKAVRKWLRYREQNPKMLQGLVKSGFRQMVIKLASESRYVPLSPAFYKALGWKQYQAKDGRRRIHIGGAVAAAESWAGLNEEQVCERITSDKPKWQRLAGLLGTVGLTKAVLAAAMDAGCLSASEIINLAPTIEEVGLLSVPRYAKKLDEALAAAPNMRAANLAMRMKSEEGEKKLQKAADVALQKEMAEAFRGLFAYVFVDVSGSMSQSIEVAKAYLPRMLPGFPLDKIVIATFRENARVLTLKEASKEGVELAFSGTRADGGTNHGEVVRVATRHRQPGPEEDAVFLWIGDGGETDFRPLVNAVETSGVRPVAFGFLKLAGQNYGCIENAASALKIPLFNVDERIFGQAAKGGPIDPYAIQRSLRAIIEAAPVGAAGMKAREVRKSLTEQILETELLSLPPWAEVMQFAKKGAEPESAAAQ